VQHVIVLLLVATLVACAASPQTPGPLAAPLPAAATTPPSERIRVAYASPAAGFIGLWHGKDSGLFEKYGLDVETSSIAGGQIIVGAVVAGELEFAEVAAPPPMSAQLEGADTVWITTAVNRPVQFLMTLPEVRSVSELRGRPVGTTRLDSTTHTFLRLALRASGLDPEQDVQYIQTGGLPETMAAIQTGRVAAGVMGSPTNLVAVQAGLHVLLDAAQLGIPWPFGGTMATRGAIASHPDRARSYVKAYTEALHLARTDRARAVESIMKYGELSDRGIAEQTYDLFQPYWSVPPLPDPAAIEVVVREELLALHPQARDVPPQAYYDDRFVRELVDSGFIRQLEGQ
jgi:NitT/TauT family transport system substrate-binding protein